VWSSCTIADVANCGSRGLRAKDSRRLGQKMRKSWEIVRFGDPKQRFCDQTLAIVLISVGSSQRPNTTGLQSVTGNFQ
jgi:hypothetical protein